MSRAMSWNRCSGILRANAYTIFAWLSSVGESGRLWVRAAAICTSCQNASSHITECSTDDVSERNKGAV